MENARCIYKRAFFKLDAVCNLLTMDDMTQPDFIDSLPRRKRRILEGIIIALSNEIYYRHGDSHEPVIVRRSALDIYRKSTSIIIRDGLREAPFLVAWVCLEPYKKIKYYTQREADKLKLLDKAQGCMQTQNSVTYNYYTFSKNIDRRQIDNRQVHMSSSDYNRMLLENAKLKAALQARAAPRLIDRHKMKRIN